MPGSVRYNRPIPFFAHARVAGTPELNGHARRRRDVHDPDRPATTPRRARRRRQSTPWLQRNALSVAAVSILVAMLGLGFGLLQMLTRPDPAPAASLALSALDSTRSVNAALGPSTDPPSLQIASVSARSSASLGDGGAAGTNGTRPIQSSAKVIEPNYTVAAGDTLGQIAVKFGTSVERIQALNNLSDPRALRIGTRLVIPPPL